MVEVTDADRDAAANLNGYARWRTWEVCPQHDEGWMILCANDFARHRIAAEQRGKLEGARLALEAAADRLIHAPPHLSMSEYADNTRAIDPAKIVGEG